MNKEVNITKKNNPAVDVIITNFNKASFIEEAILDGIIKNDYDSAYKYMIANKKKFLKG